MSHHHFEDLLAAVDQRCQPFEFALSFADLLKVVLEKVDLGAAMWVEDLLELLELDVWKD